MDPEAVKSWFATYVDRVLNGRNLDAGERDYWAPTFTNHMETEAAQGPEVARQALVPLLAGFPDLHYRVDDIIACGDKLAVYMTVSGTHKGEFMGMPPSGQWIMFHEIAIYRVEDERLTDVWPISDFQCLFEQLGLRPEAAPEAAHA